MNARKTRPKRSRPLSEILEPLSIPLDASLTPISPLEKSILSNPTFSAGLSHSKTSLSSQPRQGYSSRPRPIRIWQAAILESSVVIGVNLLLTTAAITGLARLIPVQLGQHSRLIVLEEQVTNLEQRVLGLQKIMERGMDPYQQEALMKEENRLPPNQIQVHIASPSTRIATEEPSEPRAQVQGSHSPL